MNTREHVRVREVMENHFVMMDGIDTVAEGLSALVKAGAHTIILRRRNEYDEFGIVVLADIAQKVLAPNRSPDRVNLYEIMTKPVLGIAPDMNIRYCARMFHHFGLNTAPVIDGGEVLGVVNYNDIVLNGLV